MRVFKVRRVLAILEREGWVEVRRSGSHRQLKHPTKPGTVTVAGNANDDVPVGTLRSIFRQADIPWPPE